MISDLNNLVAHVRSLNRRPVRWVLSDAVVEMLKTECGPLIVDPREANSQNQVLGIPYSLKGFCHPWDVTIYLESEPIGWKTEPEGGRAGGQDAPGLGTSCTSLAYEPYGRPVV